MNIRHEKYPVIGGGLKDLEPLINLTLAVPTIDQLEQILYLPGSKAHAEANRIQLNAIEFLAQRLTQEWRRPSPGLPGGVDDQLIKVFSLSPAEGSSRAIILPVKVSRLELDELTEQLLNHKKNYLPDGYTIDPGYHLAKACILSDNFTFDEMQGCFLSPFTRFFDEAEHCIPVACNDYDCFNPRHLDIKPEHLHFYQLQASDYITMPDMSLRFNTPERLNCVLPPYWESWDLFMNWMRPRTAEFDYFQGNYVDVENHVLSAADFTSLWVHPLTGCWELEKFYPRWDKGTMTNGYGFNRDKKHPAGRAAHRLVLYEYLVDSLSEGFPGDEQSLRDHLTSKFKQKRNQVDHMCVNRRCCNPLHLQLIDKKTHDAYTFPNKKHGNPNQLNLFKKEVEEEERIRAFMRGVDFRERQRQRERGMHLKPLPKLK